MRTRTLGRDGLVVSEIGLGCMGMTYAYGPADEPEAVRLEVLPGVGHFPHVESPTAVVQILDDFIATTGPSADVTNQKS